MVKQHFGTDSVLTSYIIPNENLNEAKLDYIRRWTKVDFKRGIELERESYQINDDVDSILRSVISYEMLEENEMFYIFEKTTDSYKANGDFFYSKTEVFKYINYELVDFQLNPEIEFDLYPNPALSSEVVLVDFNQLISADLYVVNGLGQIVQSSTINELSQYHLNLPKNQGVYFILLIDEEGNRTKTKSILVH